MATDHDQSEQLPAALRPGTASNGDRDYYRRRIDELLDAQVRGLASGIEGLVQAHRVLDDRVDAIDGKLSKIFGGLAVIVLLVNLIAPVVVRWFTGS